ncbi:arylamine N-acetyltransferase 2 [Ilyonectria robusta]|uniref:arylamine N-acetyltransferase 2 n=1 Tax=Ilyonectria robusta TaxID=1079257 RepID=UPI001E8CE079|nr:arylamine N-acetyltransferase 2 [Ilyonectria robusta]KAH8734559.1 arylamine N-acetyltransferase 2 [Ilyonectria robusta]
MAHIYSEAQVAKFLSHLKIPAEYYIGNEPILDHAFLSAIHKHMITGIPYENLLLHYSDHRSITLDPQEVYFKLIASGRGRGGYCMENSILLTHMLRALGFQVYPVGVRVRPRKDGVPYGPFPGWVHIVNIVTLADNSRWVLDVSFGGDGPTQPMALVEGSEWRNMGTQDARLIKDFIPGQTELTPGRRLWIYQCRNSPDQPWVSYYAFSHAVEWLPADFEVCNHFTSTSPRSFQTWTVLVVKFLRRPCATAAGGQEVYGKRMLVDDVVKENPGGKTKVVQECKTEEERVQALKEWFGIELTEEETQSIKGHATEIQVSK